MNKIRAAAKQCNKTLQGGGWLALAAASLLFALVTALLRGMGQGDSFSDLAFVARMNWGLFFGAGLTAFAVLLAATWLWESQKPLAAVLLASCFCFALILACDAESNIYFFMGLCLPLAFVLRWAAGDGKQPPLRNLKLQPKNNSRLTMLFAIALFAAFTGLLGYFSILRYRTYNATNFDLGIFAQMFEQLRRTGHAWTTLERNRLMTHFGVHCSPIFYLLLPFYMLVPRIETLLVLQAAAVGAGVFAVRGVARHLFGDSPRLIMGACLLYVFHPAFSQGVLFDFHENKFLTALLLGAVYFLLKNKPWPLLLFSLLTLSVKEDAAIYVVSLALFYLLCKPWKKGEGRRVATGFAMISMSVAWFVCAMAIVRNYGSGVMVDRLQNFYLPGNGEHGFADIAKVLLSNLGYVVQVVFTQEKMAFLLWVLLPLGFAPVLQKKGTAWLLLLPLLVINLLSDYGYQHEIGYQYTFGSVALAIVLALMTMRDLRPRLRRGLLLFAVMASIIITLPATGSRMRFYADVMRTNPERIAAVDQVLEELPQNAEITATTWFAVHLYKLDHVYMYPNFYDAQRVTKYLLCKPEEVEEDAQLQSFLADNGYELREETAFLRVYQAE